MRGSGWIPFILGLVVFLAAAGYPLAAGLVMAAIQDDATTGPQIESESRNPPNLWSITRTTAWWAAAVVPGALIVGWWPGRLLAALRSRAAFIACGTLCLIPICLPDYLLYWIWWQTWPVNSAIYRWAVENDSMALVRGGTLWIGLVSWSWPIAAWIIAAGPVKSQEEDLLTLDTRSRFRPRILQLRRRWRELAIAAVIIFTFAFNNTTCFDLAQIPTLGYELRAMQSEGFRPGDVLQSSWPGMVMVLAGGGIVTLVLLRRSHQQQVIVPAGKRSGMRFLAIAGGIVLLAGVVLPVALLWRERLDERTLNDLVAGYGRAARNTALAAATAGAAAGVAAIGFGAAFADRRNAVRLLAAITAGAWFFAGVVPAAAVAAALEGAYNIPFPSLGNQENANLVVRFDEAIYRTAVVMILGHLARFGFVAVLLGWWLARAEDREMRAVRELDGGESLLGVWRAWGPRWIAAGAAAFAIVTVLAMGEVSLTAFVQPPGFDAVSAILLNNMHYQRSEMVILMARILIILAAGAAVAVTMVALLFSGRWRGLRAVSSAVAIVAFTLVSGGCDDKADDSENLDSRIVFGEPGRSLGQFVYPRAMDVDAERGFIYVIDRSGRVQRFGRDGHPQKQWLLPEYDNGYPTGVTVAPDGRIYVADTHANCISIFDEDGHLLEQFGEHGTGPGQFIFPSDVVFGPQGRIYISEFGENDRVQVFDGDWAYLFEFGGFGSEPGRFNRPQSMSFNRDRTELFVADACNHRIAVFDPDGNLLRILGSVGTEPGKFRYPYGVVVLDGGRIAVTEFGNHQVQILDAKGRSLHVLGRAGEGKGELMAPWTSSVIGDDLYVLDSRNSRVQVMKLPD